VPSRSTPAFRADGPGCLRTFTPRPFVFTIRAGWNCGVGVGSSVGAGVLGVSVGPAAEGADVAVAALAAVTRGVTASVGTRVGTTAVLVPAAAFARTGGRARPAFRYASAATAPISPSNSKLLSTCQMVRRSRPPLDTNGRPHQSHSFDPPGFFPPQPGQIAIESSSERGGTAEVFYTTGRGTVPTHNRSSA